jgi:hypothetical protein
MITQHPESRDEWDDCLDALLTDADSDLQALLTDALHMGAGVRAILGPDPQRSADVATPPDETPLVSDQIARLRSLIRRLLGHGFRSNHDRVVQQCLDNLHELQEGLEARRLSWVQANQHIEAAESRLERMLSGLPRRYWATARQALRDLRTLRVAVKRLFEDSDEWSEDLAPRW